MSYKNIVFIKLEKRLLNDPRWYMMSENARFNYLRFILFAAETYNRIPRDLITIKQAFRTDQTVEEVQRTIDEIMENFPRFQGDSKYYFFDNFDEKTNFIPDKEKLKKPILTDELFINELKNNAAYKHINVDIELARMDAWFLANPSRFKTKRFVIGWLNKIEKPMESQRRQPKQEVHVPINPVEHKKVTDLIHQTVLNMKEEK
jgi:hypothetical protein